MSHELMTLIFIKALLAKLGDAPQDLFVVYTFKDKEDINPERKYFTTERRNDIPAYVEHLMRTHAKDNILIVNPDGSPESVIYRCTCGGECDGKVFRKDFETGQTFEMAAVTAH